MARIVVVGKYYPPCRGGIEVNTRDVAEFLARAHDVTVLASAHEGPSSAESLNGVAVRRYATPAVIKGQPISPGLVGGILASRADVYHLHAPNFVAAAALTARLLLGRRRPKLVITHHADVQGRRILRSLALPFYRSLARRAACVMVTSAKNAAGSADLPPDIVVRTVPLGIDLAAYSLPEAERAEARSWRGSWAGAAPLVSFVGRHARYKGLDVLVRAVAAMPGVHAVLAGDGPFREPAQRLARELGIADRVHFPGALDHAEKLRLLAASDVFAFPSTDRTEAFGIAQLEAMALGVPVVATDLPTGVTDVAVHGRTALVVPPNDPDALARALARLLADHDLAARLAGNAREALLSRFRSDLTVVQAAAIIEEALHSARSPGAAINRFTPRAVVRPFVPGRASGS